MKQMKLQIIYPGVGAPLPSSLDFLRSPEGASIDENSATEAIVDMEDDAPVMTFSYERGEGFVKRLGGTRRGSYLSPGFPRMSEAIEDSLKLRLDTEAINCIQKPMT